MKKICLVFPVLVAVLTLFAATNVCIGAGCDGSLPPGWCFENTKAGYKVEVVTTTGDFPVIDASGNSVFTYKITRTTGTKRFRDVDILIPVCTESLGNPIAWSCSPPLCGVKFYKGGSGDPSTGFGLGLRTYDTLNWNMFNDRDSITVSFTLKGIKFALQNAILVKTGLIFGDYTYGQILAPACAQTTVQEFPIEVPNTTKRDGNILGIDVCFESTDQSGCPTNTFSCNVPVESVCDCPSDTPNLPPDAFHNRAVWNRETILDANVDQGKLRRAWSDRDPRCPKTYWKTEHSCKLYVSGRGYTSSYTYAGISGYVKTAAGAPLAGVTMNACKTPPTGCQTPIQTDATGYFSLCFPIAPWSGTVTPVKSGYTFTSQQFSNITTTNSPTNAFFQSTQ